LSLVEAEDGSFLDFGVDTELYEAANEDASFEYALTGFCVDFGFLVGESTVETVDVTFVETGNALSAKAFPLWFIDAPVVSVVDLESGGCEDVDPNGPGVVRLTTGAAKALFE
jgi:hypothetical protein